MAAAAPQLPEMTPPFPLGEVGADFQVLKMEGEELFLFRFGLKNVKLKQKKGMESSSYTQSPPRTSHLEEEEQACISAFGWDVSDTLKQVFWFRPIPSPAE